MENTGENKALHFFGWLGAVVGVVFILVWISSFLWGPLYNVWEKGQKGKSELAQAEYNRQIKVLEAKARLESERLNAQSEVVRAEGVSKANVIISGSITDQYIRYLWVKTLDGAEKEIIYVPTEGNLPITEANRLQP